MDPLSVTASIAGMMTLSSTVFNGLSRYVKEAKGTKLRVADLAKETRDLSGILHNLSLLANSVEDHNSLSTFKAHHLHDCRQTLLKINKRLAGAQVDLGSGRKRDLVSRSMKWPFSNDETMELFDDMARHKGNIELALSADTMAGLLQCLSRQDELDTGLDGVKRTLEQRFQEEDRLEREEDRKKIMEFFIKVNPRPALQTTLGLRHAMTGLWLLEGAQFRVWKASSNSKLWLKRDSGIRKDRAVCGVD